MIHFCKSPSNDPHGDGSFWGYCRREDIYILKFYILVKLTLSGQHPRLQGRYVSSSSKAEALAPCCRDAPLLSSTLSPSQGPLGRAQELDYPDQHHLLDLGTGRTIAACRNCLNHFLEMLVMRQNTVSRSRHCCAIFFPL